MKREYHSCIDVCYVLYLSGFFRYQDDTTKPVDLLLELCMAHWTESPHADLWLSTDFSYL